MTIAEHAWLVVPLSVWLLTSVLQIVARGESLDFFTKDFPRMGSEFCKIALTIMLGAMAVEVRSPVFTHSWLAAIYSPLLLTLLCLAILVCFFVSFKCFRGIEGLRPRWNPRVGEITWKRWLFSLIVAEAFGVGPLAFVIYSLERRV